MEITSIFGIPAHPLFVHVPVVLVPLSLCGAIAMLSPSLRAKFGWVTVMVSLVALVFAVLATGSGEALGEYTKETKALEYHTSIGENLRVWVFLLFVFVLAAMLAKYCFRINFWVKKYNTAGESSRLVSAVVVKRVSLAMCVLAIITGVVATYWVYEIGHSGAKATWEKTQIRIDKGIKLGESSESD